jgi:hypothetical protein
LSMLRHVAQLITKHFQRVSRSLGNSTRHERDMPMLEVLAWLTLPLVVYIAIVSR